MNRRYVVALLVVLAAVALGSAAATEQRVLVVEDAETGETYLDVPVENGTVVAIEYNHSVEKTRVYDEYTVRGDSLEMTRMEFESYGWGLPSRANVTRENGTFIYDPPGSYERLTVAPGRVAGHTLYVDDRTYDLVAVSDGRSVTFSIQHRSGLTALLWSK
ncbi:hypothetical protein SAMN04488065_2347 [Haloplanus vescus]|uniref:DUF1850 domain-containing protein n=1 Tax=Haloplanus vescus TaxID=555874 RepID=A0A1H3ZH26_9EURY|nr:DUF1850 domain-containing protein [Haloplanus vescus]SEA22691.1 hypothetical protein SAMN04488065_2347 [Haloplanus vescus]